MIFFIVISEDLEWMQELPYTIHIPAWNSLVIHAGLVPGIPLEQQKPVDMTTIRNIVRKEGDSGEIEGTSRIDIGEPWTSVWNGDGQAILRNSQYPGEEKLHIIYGHDARRGLQQLPYSTGLDSGCAYGRHLSALILPDRQVVQVPARAVYTPVNEKD